MEGQTFIELCEKTTNVGYVLTQIQQEFGPEYTVVTSDGLEAKDSGVWHSRFVPEMLSSTCAIVHDFVVQACHSYINFVCVPAGMKFWKVNSRKFYAVPNEDLLAPVRKKSRERVGHQLKIMMISLVAVLMDFSNEIALLHKKKN